MQNIFIINGNSGNYNEEFMIKMAEACDKINIDMDIYLSEDINHTKEIVDYYKNKECTIYAVGGDGTINYILNLIFGSKAKLGIIPSGSGNDFYRSLDEYQSEIVPVNVMKVNDRYGINIFSIGIDALICHIANNLKNSFIPNNLIYKASLAKAFFSYHNEVIGVNDFFEKVSLLAFCNGSYYGGGFKIAPYVNICSNFLKVVETGDISKKDLIIFFYDLLKEQHNHNPNVSLFNADDKIKIEGMHPIKAQLDGELMEEYNYIVTPSVGTIDIVNNRKLIRELKKK